MRIGKPSFFASTVFLLTLSGAVRAEDPLRIVPLHNAAQVRFLNLTEAESRVAFTNATVRKRLVKEAGSRPKEVAVTWQDQPGQASVTLTSETGAVERRTVDGGRAAFTNLEIGRAYSWRAEDGGRVFEGRFRTADQGPRLLSIPGVPNFRDLGGYRGLDGRRVRQGRIFRSSGMNANATRLSPPAAEPYAAGKMLVTDEGRRMLVEKFGIRTDLDLRSDAECWGMTGSPLGQTVAWAHISSENYDGLQTKKGKAAFREAFRLFLDEANYPVLIHCISGADRTGSLTFVLNALLAVSPECLRHDWEATALWCMTMGFAHGRWDRLVAGFGGPNPVSFRKAVEDYVLSVGFTPNDIEKFRKLMLEGDVTIKSAEVKTSPRKPLSAKITCQGSYRYHVQGVAADGEALYWSFTTTLVKTDFSGKVLAKAESPERHHMGDLTVHNGKVYVGMNMSGVRGRKGDEVWEYDAATLALVRKIPTPETLWCNNGVEWCDGYFYVISSTPRHLPYNFVFAYTEDWKYVGVRTIASGWTNLGVQTIAKIDGLLFFGYYGHPKEKVMPHPSGVFAVDPEELRRGWRDPAQPDIVRSLCATKGYFAEGIFEMDGRPWRCNGLECPPPPGVNAKKYYTAEVFPDPKMTASVKKARKAPKNADSSEKKVSKTVASAKNAVKANGAKDPRQIALAGGACQFAGPLRGVCSDGASLYWSMSHDLVKTDLKGTETARFSDKDFQMGDPCWHNGFIYVCASRKMRTKACPRMTCDEVWVFEPAELRRVRVHPLPQAIFGANGIAWWGGRFWVVADAAANFPYNFVYELTENLEFVQCRPLGSGATVRGVQTICIKDDMMYFGTLGAEDAKGDFDVFVVDANEFVRNRRSHESPDIISVASRLTASATGGMFVLDGKMWTGASVVQSKNGAKGDLFGAAAYPNPALNGSLPKGASASK